MIATRPLGMTNRHQRRYINTLNIGGDLKCNHLGNRTAAPADYRMRKAN